MTRHTSENGIWTRRSRTLQAIRNRALQAGTLTRRRERGGRGLSTGCPTEPAMTISIPITGRTPRGRSDRGNGRRSMRQTRRWNIWTPIALRTIRLPCLCPIIRRTCHMSWFPSAITRSSEISTSRGVPMCRRKSARLRWRSSPDSILRQCTGGSHDICARTTWRRTRWSCFRRITGRCSAPTGL